MESILIIVESYYPKPFPNEVCVHNVALELKKMGYDVHIIGYKKNGYMKESKYEGIKIHNIKPRLFQKLRDYGEDNIAKIRGKVVYKIAKWINKIKKLMYIPIFPLTSPVNVLRYYHKAYELYKEYKFDCVIATYHPTEALLAGILLKRKIKTIKYGAYILDSLIYISGRQYLGKTLFDKLAWKFEKKVYENADRVFNMKSHETHHFAEKYYTYKSKIDFIDIPLFLPRKPKFTKSLYDSDKIHLAYTGTLFKDYRDPKYIYRLFMSINKFNLYQLHFYTKGNCEEELIKYQSESNGRVIRHGYVSNIEIDNIYYNADFLINVGVSNTTMISSKIFSYISLGKPIIHFYYNDDDVCLRYFEKYNLSLMIKMDEKLFDFNAKRLKTFLIENYGKMIDTNKIDQVYKLNSPNYTAIQFDKLAHPEKYINQNEKTKIYHIN